MNVQKWKILETRLNRARMNADHGELVVDSMYEELDSPEEADIDFGYHSIGKNIEVSRFVNLYVNLPYSLFTVVDK